MSEDYKKNADSNAFLEADRVSLRVVPSTTETAS